MIRTLALTLALALSLTWPALVDAQTLIISVTNDGESSSIAATWPATGIDVEPYPIFAADRPVGGRTMGLLVWLDDTLTDSRGRTQQVTDVLSAVSEAMRYRARANGLSEPDFVEGLRSKLEDKLREELDAATRLYGGLEVSTAAPSEVTAALIEHMPPAPEE